MPIYIKFDGIDGSVTEKGFEKWCNVLSESHGLAHIVEYNVGVGGSGGRSGKTTVQDVSIVKDKDSASPKLKEFAFLGKHVPWVEVAFVTSGTERHKTESYKLTDVIISSYNTSNTGDGGGAHESLTFNKAKIEFEFTEMQKDGTPKATARFGYDLSKATKV
jgi:type VI secretion system secreted protein Hcp